MGKGLSRSLAAFFLVVIFSLTAIGQTQRVYLNFSGNDGNINYTTAIKDAVQLELESKYSYWGVEFAQTPPASPFATLTFNSGSPGGLAQHIDFRNLILNDSAVVNADGISGITPSSSTADIINSTSTIGAHELGHLLGLRHADSYGPIGTGIGNPGPGPGVYLPDFPGPSGGNETNDHVMATPAFGATNLLRDTFLSERSATKVQFAYDGVVLNEAAGPKGSIATAQQVTFSNMTVPNTIQSGVNAGLNNFSVDAMSVIGELGASSELDFYSFDASSGDLFNFEIMSNAVEHRSGFSNFDTQISLMDGSGSLINYWGGTAFNDDEYETLDSILIDVTIPSDGTYFIQINSYNNSSNGDYELFGYRFNGEAVTAIDGDFDDDGVYDCGDVDPLVAGIVSGSNDASFDLTGDGVVNGDDLDAWLAEAGAVNLASGDSYLYGDANLDGGVDASDFNAWNSNKFTATAAWCSGDFNADGVVDAADFNLWNNNKFTSAAAASAQAVPEPNAGLMALLSVAGLLVVRRRK